MANAKPLVDHVDRVLGSCRRRCVSEPKMGRRSTLGLLCARIHTRATAETDNRVRGSKIVHNDAYWADIEGLVSTPVSSVNELFAKVRAGQTMWRFELRAGEPFHDLLRDLIAECRTVEERFLFGVLADVSELASRPLR